MKTHGFFGYFYCQTSTRQPDESDDDCLSCLITPLQVEFDDPGDSDETFFECSLLDDEHDDELVDIRYSIELPEDFLSRHEGDLMTGHAVVCISGGEAVRAIDRTDRDFIRIPENADVSLTEEHEDDLYFEYLPGLQARRRTVLVVRVIGDNGAEQPVESRNRLAGAVFGIGPLPYSNSMRAQYSRCSFGRLEFVPASGHRLISNGVMDMTLDFSLQGVDILGSRQFFREEAATLLGVSSLSSQFDHVMFCVAAGTGIVTPAETRGWSAFATISRYDTYFNSEFERCHTLSALMHELGHNLGLHHSGRDGNQYDDRTGVVRAQG